MQFLSTKTFIFLNILSLLFTKINAGVSTAVAARGRSQSMSVGSRPYEFKPLHQSRAESEISSLLPTNEAESRSSTSGLHQESDIREHQHLVEETRHVSFASPVDLTDASRTTNYGENLNPARDGVFARIHNILYGGVAPIAAGAVVGAGIVEIINSTRKHPTTMKTLLPISNGTINDSDEINLVG